MGESLLIQNPSPVTLDPLEEPVVFMVWSYPEPYYGAIIHDSKGAIANAHSRRIHRTTSANSLEVQTWVIGVRLKEAVCGARLSSYTVGK